VFDGVLRSRPGDGRLDDEAVSGLTTGMVSSAQLSAARFVRMHAPTLALLGGDVAGQASHVDKPRETGLGDRPGLGWEHHHQAFNLFLCSETKD
jgi:hypothetical protein